MSEALALRLFYVYEHRPASRLIAVFHPRCEHRFPRLDLQVILQVHDLGCRLVLRGVGTSHLGNNPIASFFSGTPTSFPEHKCAGTIALVVFKR
jgi:hypothetical protein